MNSINEVQCKCPHHRINGGLLALAALAYLLGHLGVIDAHLAGTVWPVLIMILGLNKSLGRGMCKCCTHP